jgi:glycyl-tRNA synthetase beta chain
MRWESSGFSFARPIRWIVFLHGEQVIPFEIAGISASRISYGHRTYAKEAVEIAAPESYERLLRDASVIPIREERREDVIGQVSSMAREAGLEVHGEAGVLFDENTDLTEYPRAVFCRFDEAFLDLPPEVLVSEMIEHQHYFPLVDGKTGTLSNRFIAVSNIVDNGESRAGYERVLLARLNDGRFFFDEDRKMSLDTLTGRLESVTFHEKLGSMSEKVERIDRIAGSLARILERGEEVDRQVHEVARLCKNDLVTLMVGEFPHLQGVMGYYYALSSGCTEEVALGIREHYHPRFAEDALPSEIPGAVVGIADRLDTIMSIFSIGLKPKGRGDPFALRRKVLAIIRIIIGLELHIPLRGLLQDSMNLYTVDDSAVLLEDLEEFFQNRIQSIFAEMGFLYDEINASMTGVLEDVYETYRRVRALHELRGDRDFEALLVSFRRMSNIIEEESGFEFSESLLREDEEKALHSHFVAMREGIVCHIEQRNYDEVYRILSTFKPHVDSFFDHVLVMDENPELRKNRLALLQSITSVFSGIIDFSKIVQPGD